MGITILYGTGFYMPKQFYPRAEGLHNAIYILFTNDVLSVVKVKTY